MNICNDYLLCTLLLCLRFTLQRFPKADWSCPSAQSIQHINSMPYLKWIFFPFQLLLRNLQRPDTCLFHHVKSFITLSQHILAYWGFCHLCSKCWIPVSLNGLLPNLKVALKCTNHRYSQSSERFLWSLCTTKVGWLTSCLFTVHLFISSDENVYLLMLTSCFSASPNVLLNDINQIHVRSAAYSLRPWRIETDQNLVCADMVHDFLMEALQVVGKCIHRSECKSWLDEWECSVTPA